MNHTFNGYHAPQNKCLGTKNEIQGLINELTALQVASLDLEFLKPLKGAQMKRDIF